MVIFFEQLNRSIWNLDKIVVTEFFTEFLTFLVFFKVDKLINTYFLKPINEDKNKETTTAKNYIYNLIFGGMFSIY